MTGPDCAVMCNFINTHTHTRLESYQLVSINTCSLEANMSPPAAPSHGFPAASCNNLRPVTEYLADWGIVTEFELVDPHLVLVKYQVHS